MTLPAPACSCLLLPAPAVCPALSIPLLFLLSPPPTFHMQMVPHIDCGAVRWAGRGLGGETQTVDAAVMIGPVLHSRL